MESDNNKPVTPEEEHYALLGLEVKDKSIALYILYSLLKRAAESHRFSSEELKKLNLCIEQFPGLTKIVI
jgi:hypothetical protein